MSDFISDQLDGIVSLFEKEEERKIPWLNHAIQVASNILFVIACVILLWKGCVYLFDSYFPPDTYDPVSGAMRSSVSKAIKTPGAIILMLGLFLFVTRIIVALKVYIKPFQLLSVLGLVILGIKLWNIFFDNNYSSYSEFLKNFAQDIFK